MRFVLLLLYALLAAPGLRATLDRTLDSPHFVFHYDKTTDAALINELAQSGEGDWKTLVEYFGGWTPPVNKIPVYAYGNRKAFMDATGTKGAEMVLGTASSGDLSIRLDTSELLNEAKRVIGHELTHIFIFQYLGPGVRNLPLWLHEGLASEGGGMPRGSAASRVEGTDTRGGLIPLKEIAKDFPEDSEKASIAYAQGHDIAVWLLNRDGWTSMRAFLDRLKAGDTFEAALQRVYDMNAETLEASWRSSVSRRARPWVWNNAAGVGFVGLMLAALLWGWLRVRGKWLRQVKEEEEVIVTPPPSWWPSDEEWRG